MRLPPIMAVLAVASLAGPAEAGCRDRGDCRTAPRTAAKPEPKRFEPYDPGRIGGGSRGGVFDVGGDTQVRVGGRTRIEYGYTR